MGGTNSYGAYKLDSEPYDGQYSGGLLGRMQAMMQQGWIQPDAGSNSPPNDVNSDGGLQGGLLGRLLARQAELGQYEPFSGGDGQAPSEPRDPNFRRLARVYITDQTQDGTDSDRPGSYLSQGNTANSSAPEQTIKTAQLVLPGGIPFPLPAPVTPPPIPMPAIPDWWKAAGPILRRVLSGVGGGGNDDYRRCMRASDGSIEQWEEFCRNLASGMSNTVGADTRNRACWAKTFEPTTEKQNWCKNQFGAY